ncbi:MAG: polysaccharide deacetylase family protein [Bacteroidota bacterium]
MSSAKKMASVSLDLDNQWSYMKIHGDEGWEEFPTYLDTFVPHCLDALDALDMKITFFIVGQDTIDERNTEYLQDIVHRGHEVGNHSFKHESWLHLYTDEELEYEIRETEEGIERVTGQRPIGFRGPGFSWSPNLLEILKSHGYLYDASTLPTYLGPIARMYYFWTADLSKEEREERKGLFGKFTDGLRSVKPYNWQLSNDQKLLELPVTTIPGIKTPFHLSYLLFLSGFSDALMKTYLNTAIQACKMSGTEPSFLLHPLDLIGGDQVPELKFFPGMNISSDRKIEVFNKVMTALGKHFDLVNMSEHVRQIMDTRTLKTRVPSI